MRFLRGTRFNPGVEPEVGMGRGLLHLPCILMGAQASEPRDALAAAATAIAQVHRVPAAPLCERLLAREARRSSARPGGVALPHVDMWGTTRARAAFVRLAAPLVFGAGRNAREVQDLLVLVAPRPATAIHHAMLLHYRRLLHDQDFLARLRACTSAPEVWWLFREHEWSLEQHPGPRKAAHGSRAPRAAADATLTQQPRHQG